MSENFTDAFEPEWQMDPTTPPVDDRLRADWQQELPYPRPPFDALPGQFFPPPSDAFLPPGVPGLFDRLPPSRWIDLQGFDRFDGAGNLIRVFNDGNTVVIQGNPPRSVLVSNDIITKELRLGADGRVVEAYEINKLNGTVRPRPDCRGAVVDGYGAIHGVNGRVERRNGLISPNEQAYVHGLIHGFPERWAFLPAYQDNRFHPRPYYNPQPYFPQPYMPRYRGRY